MASGGSEQSVFILLWWLSSLHLWQEPCRKVEKDEHQHPSEEDQLCWVTQPLRLHQDFKFAL